MYGAGTAGCPLVPAPQVLFALGACVAVGNGGPVAVALVAVWAPLTYDKSGWPVMLDSCLTSKRKRFPVGDLNTEELPVGPYSTAQPRAGSAQRSTLFSDPLTLRLSGAPGELSVKTVQAMLSLRR